MDGEGCDHAGQWRCVSRKKLEEINALSRFMASLSLSVYRGDFVMDTRNFDILHDPVGGCLVFMI